MKKNIYPCGLPTNNSLPIILIVHFIMTKVNLCDDCFNADK